MPVAMTPSCFFLLSPNSHTVTGKMTSRRKHRNLSLSLKVPSKEILQSCRLSLVMRIQKCDSISPPEKTAGAYSPQEHTVLQKEC